MGCLKLQSDYFYIQNRYRAFLKDPKKSLYGDFQTGKVGYNFDNIGNRNTSTVAGTQTSYTANNLNQYTAIGAQTPTYDNDGNMLTNGDWAYTWNAENRLIQAVNGTTTLEFKYDYMGRRVEKKVTENSTVTKHEYFVYDGYKLIEKLNVLDSNAITQKFVWSGDTLLSYNDTSNTYYYLHDANKNVSELLDSSGNIMAHYEYSPFGKQTVASGTYATTNPLRFSSEYYDTETDLVYYNYRYYSPGFGRWLSRDPIEEIGGWNLYGMVGNNVVNGSDYLGLCRWRNTGKIIRELGTCKYPKSGTLVGKPVVNIFKIEIEGKAGSMSIIDFFVYTADYKFVGKRKVKLYEEHARYDCNSSRYVIEKGSFIEEIEEICTKTEQFVWTDFNYPGWAPAKPPQKGPPPRMHDYLPGGRRFDEIEETKAKGDYNRAKQAEQFFSNDVGY